MNDAQFTGEYLSSGSRLIKLIFSRSYRCKLRSLGRLMFWVDFSQFARINLIAGLGDVAFVLSWSDHRVELPALGVRRVDLTQLVREDWVVCSRRRVFVCAWTWNTVSERDDSLFWVYHA